MTENKKAEFAALLRLSAEAGTLNNVTFHSPAGGDAVKMRGEMRRIGGKTVLQLETSLTEGRVSQKNVPPEEIGSAAADAFEIFRKADLTDAGGGASLMISKKGTVTLLKHGKIGAADPGKTAERAGKLSLRGNDREKKRLLDGSEAFLTALGISDASGRVHDRMQSKFRQIARFSEYVAEAEKRIGGDGELYVCDLCCGKSYLSFAAYHTLTAICGRRVRMDCVDLKASVMETCAEIARKAGFDGMRFHAMNVGDFEPECRPDLVVSLHACDTATDLVLDFAAAHGATVILSTPCCQRELNRSMDCPPMDFVADVPILRQKLASAATDALRLLKLEAEGYRCDATELIDPEDTPKNVMLRAERRKNFDPASPDAEKARNRYLAAAAFLFGERIPAHWTELTGIFCGMRPEETPSSRSASDPDGAGNTPEHPRLNDMDTNERLRTISRTDVTAAERLDALRDLKKAVDAGDIPTPARGIYVNNHIHTCFSFSPYTPTSAVWYAWMAGLRTAGIMDHDSVGGIREFVEAGKIMDMPVTCGFECRVNVTGTPLDGRKVNNPDQKSCAYLAMHGIPHTKIGEAEAVLAGLREKRNDRNRKMVANINALTASAGISLDFDRDVYPLSMAKEGGSVTERHICYALTKKITGAYPDRSDACGFIEKLTGVPMSAKTKDKLLTAPDNFYEYDILGVLKGHLVEKFYVDATDECMNIREFTALADRLGAISAYAYLGDVGESPTGDKKAQKFEDDYLDELFDTLADCGFDAVTYMPSRNTKEQLARVMRMCDERGLFQISGEDINSPRQSFVCEALKEYPHLMKATYALIGHELAATDDLSSAMFSAETRAKYPDLAERTGIYARRGGYAD